MSTNGDVFPPAFLWGAATAAFQVEGATADGGRGPSIWDVFCATPGKTARGETGEIACDHYHRFRDDVELMRRLNLRAYRFSVSWPRVLPQGRGDINKQGLSFYDRLVDCLLAAGIEPMVTLYHWDLPAALQMELGGWAHPDLPLIFADYADVLFNTLGDRVHHWVTLNEPWVVVIAGYIHGTHAPGVKDAGLAYRVAHNLLRAHAHAVARYRASPHNRGAIGPALNVLQAFPASESPADVAAAERATLEFCGWFGDPLYYGDYADVLRERFGAALPEFTAEDARLLTRSMDFFGLNYYFSHVIRHAPGAGPLEIEVVPQPQIPHTTMSWPVTPGGLCPLLHWLSRRYAGLPIYITENGAAFPDQADASGFVNDQPRIAYLRDHVRAVGQALAEGVDVRGYFVWSLMDNLEWTLGFSQRFGLVRCDSETSQRTIKASGHWYSELISTGRLDDVPNADGAERMGVSL